MVSSFSNGKSESKASFSPIEGKEKSYYLKALLNKEKIIIPQDKKSELLKSILLYYKLHHYNLDGITSHLVIETLRQ